MKINATQFTATAAATQTAQETRSGKMTAEKTTGKSPAQPETQSTVMLNEAKTQLNAMPDVDMERVNALKDAISQGKIQVNCDELAQSIQDFFRS